MVTSVMSLLLPGVQGFRGLSGPPLVGRLGGCPTPTTPQVTRRDATPTSTGTGTTSAYGRAELAGFTERRARDAVPTHHRKRLQHLGWARCDAHQATVACPFRSSDGA